MTAVATAMAGRLVAFTPKAVGKDVKAGKSCATMESGKWVGPAKVAAGGTVVQINEALVATPSIANEDPYGQGWLHDPEAGGLGSREADAGAGHSGRRPLRGKNGRRRLRRVRVMTRAAAERRAPRLRCDGAAPERTRCAAFSAIARCTVLKALANEVRLMLVCQLAEGEKSVGELQACVRSEPVRGLATSGAAAGA